MGREAQHIDHERNMDDTSSYAEHAGYEAYTTGTDNTQGTVVFEPRGNFRCCVIVLFTGVVPVHKGCHTQKKAAVVKVKGFIGEAVGCVGTEKRTRKGSKRERDGSVIEDATLAYVCDGSRKRIGEYYKERSADNLRCFVKVRVYAARRHEKYEEWNQNEPASDTHKGAEGADSYPEKKKNRVFHERSSFLKNFGQHIDGIICQ